MDLINRLILVERVGCVNGDVVPQINRLTSSIIGICKSIQQVK